MVGSFTGHMVNDNLVVLNQVSRGVSMWDHLSQEARYKLGEVIKFLRKKKPPNQKINITLLLQLTGQITIHCKSMQNVCGGDESH